MAAARIDEMHVGPPAHFFADIWGDNGILKEWIFAHNLDFKNGFNRSVLMDFAAQFAFSMGKVARD